MMRMQTYSLKAIFCAITVGLIVTLTCSEGARLRRAVMMAMEGNSHPNCQSATINERNSSTTIVLTGTVTECDKSHREKYTCNVQVWRIMKGTKLAEDLMEHQEEVPLATTSIFTEIDGLGNPAFCNSEVKVGKTRIFFLNRVDDRLVLAASLLHITLANLENTQKVVQGIPVVEAPKKEEDPCLYVLCGYGATCQSSSNGTATCVCPKVTCGGTPGSSDIFAPVCGSDGVTYPSECRIKAAQCWNQRRIRVVSKEPCPPIKETDPCAKVYCGNSARCVLEDGKAKCQCRTCADVPTQPICASNQKTYRTDCDMKRSACLTAQSLRVVRRSTCDPCESYNEETKMFEPQCTGPCSLDKNGTSRCCDSIECTETDEMMICGNDGRTYESRCALLRYACKTGKNIEGVSEGSCPRPRETTLVQGSISIAADDKCPGNCDSASPEFIAFKKAFEKNVNMNLKKENRADIDARSLTSFKVEEVRRASAVLVYRVEMSWHDEPIDENFTPGADSLWAFQRLHDPANGVLKKVMMAMDVTFVAYKKPSDDFMVQEVCGTIQCDHGAGCLVSKDESGGFQYACDCSVIGVSMRLPVTLGCKLANNDRFYDNKVAVKQASCSMKTFLTFRDVCREPSNNPCNEIVCAKIGSTCIITNGKASCQCITCSEDFEPVCGSDGKTYKNLCLLNSESCKQRKEITIKRRGMCASQCDEVDCQNGGQCEELARRGALCTCPSSCVEVYAPVCGSDGITYENECKMVVESCKGKTHVTVVKRKPCDEDGGYVEPPIEWGSGEGSGEIDSDECGCRFGAVCDATVDDEDARCTCDIKCETDVAPGSQVCGSDGRTYISECEMLKASCGMQRFIQVRGQGPCKVSCLQSFYGCCDDGLTTAKGREKAGCPETCKCNEHGSYARTCNHTTGQCVCRPGVGGLKCDQCQPGFWNFRAIADMRTVGCMDCQCNRGGAVRDDCDQMTGQCKCKTGITGVKCSTCPSGAWVTPTGCSGEDKEPSEAMSCDELDCKFGQVCADDESMKGVFICQCPPLSSCDGYLSGKVCGSNGITYADECQMKIVACREEVVISVQAEGSCEAYFKSIKPFKPPVTLETMPMVRTSTTMMTTTTPMTTQSTLVLSHRSRTTIEPEGSGDMVSHHGNTIDDEDGEKESSGDIDMFEPTDGLEAGNLMTPDTPIWHNAMAVIARGSDGADLTNTMGLMSKDTEEYGEASAAIKTRIAEMLNQMGSSDIRLDDIDFSRSDIKGIKTTFSILIPSGMSRSQIEDRINADLEEGESFSFTDKVVPTDTTLANMTYIEDGEWSVPQFGGSSYLELPKMSAYNAATIHMRFRTADTDGLLLYNGQEEGRDFISLAVIGGYVEFRFDTGSGELSLRSAIPVDDGMMHKVVLRRNRREGMLKVDDEREISGNSQSGTAGLNLDTSLFIGGYVSSQQDKIFKQTKMKKGLTGCISELKIGEHGHNLVDISSNNNMIINSYRVAECARSPCLPNPCKFSGKCFITYQLDEFTYKCDCGSQYFGQQCEHRTTNHACSPSPCHESSTCVEEKDSYRCICPMSRTGNLCDRRVPDGTLPSVMEPSYMPVFAGDSYIRRPSLEGVSTRLEVEIVFYTFQPEGLLFYNGQKESGKGDFVVLNIRNGYLEFIYNLGEGTAEIKSPMPVSLNEWHVAKLSRLGRLGDLKLDDGPMIKGMSPQSHSQLNLGQPLYIGAVDDTVTVPEAAHITTGLMGAIQKFVVNDVTFPRSLMSDDAVSYNVQAFNGHPCYRKPCENEGICTPDMGDFSCNCMAGFAGEHCEIVEELDRGIMLQDAIGEAVYFDGRMHAQYNNFITRSDHSFKMNHFEFQLKTTAFHGLILYDGKPSKRGDYIALALSYGRLHLTFDLGSGAANIVSELTVNDGLWKTVKIIRNEHKATLQVDNSLPVQASAPHLTKWLNTEGMLWLGGCNAEYMPPRHRGMPKSFYMGFNGCIRQFRVDGVLLHLRDDIRNSIHLGTCQER